MPNSTVYNTGAYDSQRGAGCHSDQLVLYSILPAWVFCLVPIQHNWTPLEPKWPTVVALGHWVPTGVQYAVKLSAEVLGRSPGLGFLSNTNSKSCATAGIAVHLYSPGSLFRAVATARFTTRAGSSRREKKKKWSAMHTSAHARRY